jgi:hypothetical protein
MATGRHKSWAWDHFDTNKQKYKFNNTYFNAWCSAELKLEVNILRETDRDAIRDDPTYTLRSAEQLWAQGNSDINY